MIETDHSHRASSCKQSSESDYSAINVTVKKSSIRKENECGTDIEEKTNFCRVCFNRTPRVGCPNSAGKKYACQWLTCNFVVPHRTELILWSLNRAKIAASNGVCMIRKRFAFMLQQAQQYVRGQFFLFFSMFLIMPLWVFLATIGPVLAQNRIFLQIEQDFTYTDFWIITVFCGARSINGRNTARRAISFVLNGWTGEVSLRKSYSIWRKILFCAKTGPIVAKNTHSGMIRNIEKNRKNWPLTYCCACCNMKANRFLIMQTPFDAAIFALFSDQRISSVRWGTTKLQVNHWQAYFFPAELGHPTLLRSDQETIEDKQVNLSLFADRHFMYYQDPAKNDREKKILVRTSFSLSIVQLYYFSRLKLAFFLFLVHLHALLRNTIEHYIEYSCANPRVTLWTEISHEYYVQGILRNCAYN